mgnify:CR=1 FL=1
MSDRRSQSFRREEVELACELLRGLGTGRDVRVLMSRKEFRTFTRRIYAMKGSFDAARAEDERRRRQGLPDWVAEAQVLHSDAATKRAPRR